MSRNVITGLGVISSLGNDVATFWERMKAGESGAGLIDTFDTSDFPTRIACLVKDFEAADWMDAKEARRLNRPAQLALAASRQAVAHAGLELDAIERSRVGVIVNTGGGGMDTVAEGERRLLDKGPRGVSPFLMPNAMPNSAASVVSIELGVTGTVVASTLACASGNYALLDAAYHLDRGDAEVVIAGGTESAVSPVILASFARMGALSASDDAQTASRPFDKDRDGLVFGEGAAVFVIETEEHARARGAAILAEVLGGALTSDAHHLTMPRPGGSVAAAAMRGALASSSRNAADVDVIYAHATSTPLGDVAEATAIKTVFGERRVPTSATKSQLGHTFGAAGAMSSLAAVKSIEEGVICPTINYRTPDPECDLDCVPNEARSRDVDVAMVNAFGFGGQNVVLVLGRY